MLRIVLAALWAVGTVSAVARADDAPPTKIAPPDAAWLVTATKSIKAQYAADIAKATNNDLKAVLAKKILTAGKTETDSTGKYALLCYARDNGAAAGDFTSAFGAIDALEAGYQIDALAMKATATTEIAKSLEWNGPRRLFMQMLGPVVDQAMAADRYDAAAPLAAGMTACEQAVNDADALKYWTARVEQIRQSNLAYKKLKTEADTLVQSPNDPAANLAMGSFRCFVKGDWEHGLPMLVIGGDDTMKAAAAADIKEASGDDPAAVGAQQIVIADGWFDLSQKAKGPDRRAMQQRALRWYGRATAMVGGAEKTKIEKRMAQLESAAPPAIPAKATSTDIMADMIGSPDATEFENDVVVLKNNERLRTKKGVPPPVIFDMVAMTDSNNLCIGYAADIFGFAWERDPTMLAIAGGVVGVKKVPGQGAVPAKQWVDIELILTPKTLALSAGGRLRFQMTGEFENVKDALKIFACEGSVVRVKSVVMTTPG